ncbi:serine/threonine-protein kinase [Vitiosangium sp. GDMCC 1.1324]|uniref:serine/threonine-protein kinase n=1 Tax=Vitiosangium sp. (strain GDMCC 1.1324) TaxID=2138576 RepID=UPI000D38501A|nr:serine/threonine-protein kinase [Vitiosangium sp. GDMCC 1.1324]PTL79992.1 serine/threonine-protein kinase PknK [Vitiosangium sp. GDMCC 1.1324]
MESTTLTIRRAPGEPTAPMAPSLPTGTLIAGRFTLESLAGHGGMGTVYRAIDGLSGQPVALKLLRVDEARARQRFTREISLLAELRHPGIVSYVAHGHTEQEHPFLAMEWLDGEDLSRRLARQPLSLAETLSLLRRAAEALASAHQRRVIHRDLKPSNLFLRQGRPEDVVLLDFGLARHMDSSSFMTASQVLLGTPGYMAPEQVSGQEQLTASADIFSLGCVLYECLTGQPPFRAPHLMATLAKILFTEPVPLREPRPELPSSLQRLLDRMLAKEPARRLPDAHGLLGALEELRAHLETGPDATPSPSAPLPGLATAGQQLVTVLLAAPRVPGEPGSRQALRDSLRPLLLPHDARVELLADGALVATLVASLGSATDPASLAARCALLLLEQWPDALVVLTTGRGALAPHLPMGEAMDRAGQLLRQVDALPPGAAPVLLDEVTAGLLGSCFQLTRAQSGLFLLHGEHLSADESRPLLGRPTPCVGREQELSLLHMTFSTCVEEPTAQAVLMTAPAGTGKSRLRHEFLRRLERHEPSPLVLLGRGDPMSAGSADGLLAQALRRLCGVSGGEPLEERRARLSRRLSQHLPETQARDVVEFLGELCAIPFPDEHSPRLRAARGDPRLMSTQVERALVAWLGAECAHHPVLLVLEDLHWGDQLSVRLIDTALRELAEQPLMVLALARPEVEPLLAGLRTRRLQEVPLRELSRKAGARLVREVLGAQVSDALVDRLVEQAAGNALFLEELIRAVVEGRGESPPETVLAMLQARLGRLEPEARQVLLAASFLGRTFWAGGVRTLLSGKLSEEALKGWIQRLVEQEWVQPQPDSRFPGEAEYRFRHALVRDAAYGLVPDSHKPDGHRLAGTWLEQAGESDPRVLAEHASLGQQPERAIPFLTRAATQHFERHDLPGTLQCVEAALTLGAQGTNLVRLRALRVATAFWMGDFVLLFEKGPEVLTALSPGDPLWCKLMGMMIGGGGLFGRHEEMAGYGQLLLGTTPEAGATAAYIEALSLLCCAASWVGERPRAVILLERMAEVMSTQAMAREPLASGWVGLAWNFVHYVLEARPWQAFVDASQSISGFQELGAEGNALSARALTGQALAALGDVPGAEEMLRLSLSTARQTKQSLAISVARTHLAATLAGSLEPGHWEEARILAREEMEDTGPLLHRGWSQITLARAAAHRGEWAEAEADALGACELLAPYPPYRLFARTVLARARLAQGRTREAREMATLCARELEALGGAGTAAVGVHLALTETCLAGGDFQAGEEALRDALWCLRERARDIPEEAARERFLRQVPENARTLELAQQRWGATEEP